MPGHQFEGGPSPIIKVFVNGMGEVVGVKDMQDKNLEPGDYFDPNKRLDNGAVLVTENYCRWQLVHGVWKCI